jgi:hypothetical protein
MSFTDSSGLHESTFILNKEYSFSNDSRDSWDGTDVAGGRTCSYGNITALPFISLSQIGAYMVFSTQARYVYNGVLQSGIISASGLNTGGMDNWKLNCNNLLVGSGKPDSSNAYVSISLQFDDLVDVRDYVL